MRIFILFITILFHATSLSQISKPKMVIAVVVDQMKYEYVYHIDSPIKTEAEGLFSGTGFFRPQQQNFFWHTHIPIGNYEMKWNRDV